MSIDYAPTKLDNSVLLDYGVLDTTAPKVGCRLYHGTGCAALLLHG